MFILSKVNRNDVTPAANGTPAANRSDGTTAANVTPAANRSDGTPVAQKPLTKAAEDAGALLANMRNDIV